MVILIYLLILFRIAVDTSTMQAQRIGKLLIIGAGLPVILQAFINMGVALNILPVTGQTSTTTE